MAKIAGIFNILATPFDDNLNIDQASLQNLVDFQIDMGTHGFTILGVLGEASKLSVEERQLVVDTVIQRVDGRVPVIVGTSHNDVKTCISLSQNAIVAGAAGVMIAPPYSEMPTKDSSSVLAFYEEVASHYTSPIVVQDFPPVNNITMTPDFLALIAEKIPNARHLKLEDPPLLQKITQIRERTNLYEIFGGLGGMFFLEELKRGASGTMTGFAFTEILVAVFDLFNQGEYEQSSLLFDRYLPLIRFENQPVINLTIRKAILHRRGAISNPSLRQPFVPIDESTLQEIEWVLKRAGIVNPTAKLTF